MKTFIIVLYLFAETCFISKLRTHGFPLPFSQYSYMIARNQIQQLDGLNLKETSKKERIVSIHFEKLKSDELKRTSKHFFGSKPIETEFKKITSSELFEKLKHLPKGGNLHIHENQMLNRRYFLEMIKNSTEYDYLYICDKELKHFCKINSCSCDQYYLTYFKNASHSSSDGWVKVKGSNWTIDAIVNKSTLIGLLNNLDKPISLTDSSGRWQVANPIFSIYSDIIKYNKTRFDYLKACLDLSLDENVQLIEFRRSFFKGLYYFDEAGNRVPLSINYEIEALEKFKIEYIEKNPEFIDFNYILYGSRWKSKEEIHENLENVLSLQKQYQHFIRGYDLVGEEDLGHSLLFHSDALIQGLNYSFRSNESFKYYFHTGETNWPTDMNPSQYGDEPSADNNVFDALLFKTQRIGHGLAYFKHPSLYPLLKKNQIAIETCPASNQILGFVTDLRNHPAINFYKSGIPIVIAGDDPGSFGYNHLTVDYYLAFLNFGLSLYDLREIANNSIRYSSTTESVKLIGFKKFSLQWSKFIDLFYEQICSNLTEKSINNSNFSFNLMGPSYGPIKSIQIIIYGYGFENMLCRELSCYFNDTKTLGYFKSFNQILCSTPDGFKENDLTNIHISFGDFKIYTSLTYRFISNNSLDLIYNNSSKSTRASSTIFLMLVLCVNWFVC